MKTVWLIFSHVNHYRKISSKLLFQAELVRRFRGNLMFEGGEEWEEDHWKGVSSAHLGLSVRTSFSLSPSSSRDRVVGRGWGGGLSLWSHSKQGQFRSNSTISLGRRHRFSGGKAVGCSKDVLYSVFRLSAAWTMVIQRKYWCLFYFWNRSGQSSTPNEAEPGLYAQILIALHREKSYWINPKSDCIYHSSIDLEPNRRPFGSKSIGIW